MAHYIEDTILAEVTARRVWYDVRGASGCAKRIVNRAPSVQGWVMLTLTVDPALFPAGPESAYRQIMRDYPRVMKALARLNGGPLRWARKLELQENGWPHWHLIVNLRKLRRDELPRLDALWQHGMTNVRFLRDKRALFYALKYCSKAVSGEDGGMGLPDWVLDFPTRIRWWQTHAFYDVPAVSAGKFSESKHSSVAVRLTIREQIQRRKRMLQVIVYNRFAQSIVSRQNLLLDFEVRPYMLNIVRQHYRPGCPPELQGLSSNITIQVQVCLKQTNLPVMPLPGRVFMSLAA